MFESIQFHNFKVLKDTVLPLGPFTLLVGPNGSGKSTALQAFQHVINPHISGYAGAASADVRLSENAQVEVFLKWAAPRGFAVKATLMLRQHPTVQWFDSAGGNLSDVLTRNRLEHELGQVRIYSFEPVQLYAGVTLQPNMQLAPNGAGLAGVLDQLRDTDPERFEALNRELGRLMPEFDRILFETPSNQARAFALRSRKGRHAIPAHHLSHGTLLALALLTLAHLPSPPPFIGLEDPDRCIHPRLLRDVRDAIYRLCYPEDYHEDRPAVQVVATTHSPYFLDLFKDHPEEVVIAQKDGLQATFERLVDRPDIREILADAPLGEVWYSGVLGGVPSNR
jgi:predicted ATPase